MFKFVTSIVFVSLTVAAAAPLQAAPVYYTNQGSFVAATGSLSALDLSTPLQPGPTLTFPGLTITIPTWYSTNANELFYGGNGVQGYTNSPAAFTFNFASSITAFGATVTDLGTLGSTTFNLSVYSGATLLGTQDLFTNFAGNSPNDLFAGVMDSGGFDRLVFSGTVTGDYVELKSIQISAVPEPTSLALFGVGLAALAASRRRKAA